MTSLYEIRYYDAAGVQLGAEGCGREYHADEIAEMSRADHPEYVQASLYFLGSSDRSVPTFNRRLF